jgi:hypothetical protein
MILVERCLKLFFLFLIFHYLGHLIIRVPDTLLLVGLGLMGRLGRANGGGTRLLLTF